MARFSSKNSKLVYSTDHALPAKEVAPAAVATLPPGQQDLRVQRDRKQRKGKTVTLVTGFIGTDSDLQDLGKELKARCGAGGSVKKGEILIQGDMCDRVVGFLREAGYRVKQAGG